MLNTLRKSFNIACFALYPANELAQKIDKYVAPVYDHLPGGLYINYYMGSFCGAAAAAWVIKMNAPLASDAFNTARNLVGLRPRAWDHFKEEAAVAGAAALLTLWEWRHMHGGRWDMGDMACYAVALGLYYALNKPVTMREQHTANPRP